MVFPKTLNLRIKGNKYRKILKRDACHIWLVIHPHHLAPACIREDLVFEGMIWEWHWHRVAGCGESTPILLTDSPWLSSTKGWCRASCKLFFRSIVILCESLMSHIFWLFFCPFLLLRNILCVIFELMWKNIWGNQILRKKALFLVHSWGGFSL